MREKELQVELKRMCRCLHLEKQERRVIEDAYFDTLGLLGPIEEKLDDAEGWSTFYKKKVEELESELNRVYSKALYEFTMPQLLRAVVGKALRLLKIQRKVNYENKKS